MPRSTKARVPDDSDLVDALVQTSFEVMATLTQVATAFDVSLTQLRVLAILRDREPTMSELAAHLGLDKSTISGLIDRASGRGLVRRVADEQDRRSSRVSLTRQGRNVAQRGESEVSRRLRPLTESLSPADQATAARLLFDMLPDAGTDRTHA